MSPGDGTSELRLSERPRSDNETLVPGRRTPAMSTRLVGLSGLLGFDLIVIGTFVAPPLWNAPPTHSSAEAVAIYAGRNATRITLSLFSLQLGDGIVHLLRRRTLELVAPTRAGSANSLVSPGPRRNHLGRTDPFRICPGLPAGLPKRAPRHRRFARRYDLWVTRGFRNPDGSFLGCVHRARTSPWLPSQVDRLHRRRRRRCSRTHRSIVPQPWRIPLLGERGDRPGSRDFLRMDTGYICRLVPRSFDTRTLKATDLVSKRHSGN
jgi:hypothetical protein